MHHYFSGLALGGSVVFLLSFTPAGVSNPATAQSVRSEPRYEVTGFRGARFGMTELEVRQAAKSSFGIDDGDITQNAMDVEGNTKLIAHVQNIDNGLGAGRIEYFFGYRQRRLFRVNVVWGLDPNPNSSAVVAGAARLQSYFLSFAWSSRSVRTGLPLSDRSVLLFGGDDGKNGAVSLVIEGVPYLLGPNRSVTLLPAARSQAKLTISYTDGSNDPDVRSIGYGAF